MGRFNGPMIGGLGIIRRRKFISFLGGASATWPLAARGQAKNPVVGFLSTRSAEEATSHTGGFLQGLKDTGFTVPNNLTVTYRWARGNYSALPALAVELIATSPTVLAAGGDPAALALVATTKSVPVAFLIGDDPVRIGLVASLNRPGGNATGVSLITSALGAKRLEVLLQIVPSTRTVALLINPTNPNATAHALEVETAATALGRRLIVTRANADDQFDNSVSALKQQGVGALIVQNDPFFDTRRDRLVALMAQHALPAIFHIREFAEGGGLVSYGPSLVSAYRELGLQVGRLLHGASPQSLPVVRPNTFEFVINIKTAKKLGITVPDTILVSANEVIE